MKDASWYRYNRDDFDGTHKDESGQEIKGAIATYEDVADEFGRKRWIRRVASRDELAARIEYFQQIKNHRENMSRLRAMRERDQ